MFRKKGEKVNVILSEGLNNCNYKEDRKNLLNNYFPKDTTATGRPRIRRKRPVVRIIGYYDS